VCGLIGANLASKAPEVVLARFASSRSARYEPLRIDWSPVSVQRMIVLALVVLSVVLAGLYAIGRALIARVETVDVSSLSPLPGAKFIQLRTGRVHYLDMGTGSPILLLHGSGRSIADWLQGTAQGALVLPA